MCRTTKLELPMRENEVETNNGNKLYKQAVRCANAKIGFYIHFTIYAVVILMLATINLLFTPEFPWFIFPMFGWGIGVAIQGAVTFIAFNSDLKQRMIQTELNRLESTPTQPLVLKTWDKMPDWKDA